MPAPLTAFYAGMLALLLIAVSWRVAQMRHRFKVGLGSGGQKTLDRAIRVQANLIEYVPIALVLLLIFELNAGAHWLIHLAGIALIASRLLHAWGLSRHAGTSVGRFWGTLGTWLVITMLALLDVTQFLRA